jgi:hypothetical protein
MDRRPRRPSALDGAQEVQAARGGKVIDEPDAPRPHRMTMSTLMTKRKRHRQRDREQPRPLLGVDGIVPA